MSEKKKKRSNSLRRILPSLFFPSKSKHKVDDDNPKIVKLDNFQSNISCNNTYTTVVNSSSLQSNAAIYEPLPEENRIYENLKPYQDNYNAKKFAISEDFSTTSSSTTLVSESASTKFVPTKNRFVCTGSSYEPKKEELNHLIAGPQVPCILNQEIKSDSVYYHDLQNTPTFHVRNSSLENDETNDSEKYMQSVGAKIKCTSTQFTISPKKESAVRLNKQLRANTLSFESKKKESLLEPFEKSNIRHSIQPQDSEKPYEYSAPATPILVGNKNKIPNMPQVHKSVSPYDHVRKSFSLAEEASKYNSLNSDHIRNHYLSPDRTQRIVINSRPATVGSTRRIFISSKNLDDRIRKQNTRQNVEAFYWQKLQQMKAKEEQYLLGNSITCSENVAETVDINVTPKIYADRRSHSLPRQSTLQHATNGATIESNKNIFSLEGMGRKTVGTTSSDCETIPEPDVVLRNPDKYKQLLDERSRGDKVDIEKYNKGVNMNGTIAKSYGNSLTHKDRKYYNQHDNKRNVILCTQELKVRLDEFNTKNTVAPARANSWTSAAASAKYLLKARIKSNNGVAQPVRIIYSGSESSSEASEIQRIMQATTLKEDDTRHEDYQSALSDVESGRAPSRGRPSRRDDPRRHTLAGNHHYMHAYHPQQLSALDLERRRDPYRSNVPEYATVDKYKEPSQRDLSKMQKQSMSRGYQAAPNAMFDDDPGIMSEVETSSTGFRRGGKQRSSLPVVRTPSKTLERPLGLVFLQFRNETKRALLPNEITSIDTVKALFVRSFPQQLNMHYMDSPLVKIYIHDSSKDMFYELEDKRAHLRDIGDRSVLRLFESVELGGGGFPGALNVGTVAMPPGAAGCSGPPSWDQDQSYFSEPEMDSEYHHQHIHKSKQKVAPQAYYMGPTPPSTLPRGGSLLRTYSPATPPVPADRVKSLPAGQGNSPDTLPVSADHVKTLPAGQALAQQGTEVYIPSPERLNMRYEDAYYPPYTAPVAVRNQPPIDEEARMAPGEMVRYQERSEGDRWFGVERQLANLTGLVTALVNDETHGLPGVHKPLHGACAHAAPGGHACAGCNNTGPPPAPRLNLEYPYRGQDVGDEYTTTMKRAPKLGKDRYQKSVSFEKSVSFSDDPPDMNSPKQHSPIHAADSKPPKPAIKSSTLPRTSSQERDRLKPAPPPKPVGLVAPPPPPGVVQPAEQAVVTISAELAQCIREAQRDAIDLQMQLRNLRRTVTLHASSLRKMIGDTTQEIHELTEANKRHIDTVYYLEECYRQQMIQLESDLYELEALVERLRGKAANGEVRVNMSDVEQIAMVLSRSSRTVADWKVNLPILCDKMKRKIAQEMEKLVRKEKLLEEEPERLELALRRCKKLTGTLVTLKRLACVQEQRLPCSDTGRESPVSSLSSSIACFPLPEETPEEGVPSHIPTAHSKVTDAGGVECAHPAAGPVCTLPNSAGRDHQRSENALDALLDELQTFAKPPSERCQGSGGVGGAAVAPGSCGSLRRLHSYPSGSDTDASPPVRARNQTAAKPPVPERHPELLALVTRRAPPPPPPRTSSKSPLPSPESIKSPPCTINSSASVESSADSGSSKQFALEQRHQELLKKQKALQEQYARLQQLQRSSNNLPVSGTQDLKKTGSESNLLGKLNLNMTVSGSLTHLAAAAGSGLASTGLHPSVCGEDSLPHSISSTHADKLLSNKPNSDTTSTKVYETDIL